MTKRVDKSAVSSDAKIGNRDTSKCHPVLLLSQAMIRSGGGSGVVVSNLASGFSDEEMIVAGEAGWDSENIIRPETGERPFHVLSRTLPKGMRGSNIWQILCAPIIVFRVRKLILQNNCKQLVAVFPNEYFLFAGWLASRMTRIELFAYFHNTYLDNRSGLRARLAGWLQRRVFRDSKEVLLLSDGMLAFFKRRYPNLGNCKVLRHSVVEPIPVFSALPKPNKELKFMMAGNINESCLDAARRMAEAVSGIEGSHLKYGSGLKQTYYESCGMWYDNCSLKNRTSSAELIADNAKADILLLPHGLTGKHNAVEYETIFPTRTIEYLISGRPILAHTPKNVFLTKFLEENKCALIVNDADIDALLIAIERLRTESDLRETLVRNALKTAELFKLKTVQASFRAALSLPDMNQE